GGVILIAAPAIAVAPAIYTIAVARGVEVHAVDPVSGRAVALPIDTCPAIAGTLTADAIRCAAGEDAGSVRTGVRKIATIRDSDWGSGHSKYTAHCRAGALV